MALRRALDRYSRTLAGAIPRISAISALSISRKYLKSFFCYITGVRKEYGGEYGTDYQDKKWYRKADDKYHVPVADIEEVLNRYFEGINFNPAQIDYYQAQTKEVVIGGIGGFGGGRFPKVAEKELIDKEDENEKSILRLVIIFYYNWAAVRLQQ